MSSIQDQIYKRLIVSCQAWPGDPLDDTDAIRRIALAALRGGAAGLRINSARHIAAIRRDTDVPIIGLEKRLIDGIYRITPDFEAASALAFAGASIIALDCTQRVWTYGDPWRAMIARVHSELHLPVLADVATVEEAIAACDAGADLVGTTLCGYTESTRHVRSFSWLLLEELVHRIHVPVIAEGRVETPAEARRAMVCGAWSVVVGSAITRPGDIAAKFNQALNPKTNASPAIGIDLGGTSIKAGLVADDGSILRSFQRPTEAKKGRDAIAMNLKDAIVQVVHAARDAGIAPSGLGIASAGVVTAEEGTVFAATENLPGWTGFPLREFAEGISDLPVFVINDAQAAALAELKFGAGRALQNFVAITLGTGVGGGIVSSGKLLEGQHGYAGTIGHQVIHTGGWLCNCGRRGCLEAYVSTTSLVKIFRELGGTADSAQDDAAFAYQVGRLAVAGDALARKAYGILGKNLAEGIANIFNLLDPQAVFLSGGLVEDQSDFIREVEQEVMDLLHCGVKRRPVVKAGTSGHLAGVQGAGALVFGGVC